MWTVAQCLSQASLRLKVRGQYGHLNAAGECWVEAWRLKFCPFLNWAPHALQVNITCMGPWLPVKWRRRLYAEARMAMQPSTGHWNPSTRFASRVGLAFGSGTWFVRARSVRFWEAGWVCSRLVGTDSASDFDSLELSCSSSGASESLSSSGKSNTSGASICVRGAFVGPGPRGAMPLVPAECFQMRGMCYLP